MKRIITFVVLLALGAYVLSSCEKDKGLLKSDATISLREKAGVRKSSTRAEDAHFSAANIVKYTDQMFFINKTLYPNSDRVARGFADGQRDVAGERLMMWGDDVIYNGNIINDFIGGQNVVLVCARTENDGTLMTPPRDDSGYYVNGREYTYAQDGAIIFDTIAYIPNATLRKAYTEIHAAFDREDYTTVYQLFDDAFRWIPITGAEWQALKAKGEN